MQGSGHQASINLDQLRQEAVQGDSLIRDKRIAAGPKASEGYGGKFGVQKDRMDKVPISTYRHSDAYPGTVYLDQLEGVTLLRVDRRFMALTYT